MRSRRFLYRVRVDCELLFLPESIELPTLPMFSTTSSDFVYVWNNLNFMLGDTVSKPISSGLMSSRKFAKWKKETQKHFSTSVRSLVCSMQTCRPFEYFRKTFFFHFKFESILFRNSKTSVWLIRVKWFKTKTVFDAFLRSSHKRSFLAAFHLFRMPQNYSWQYIAHTKRILMINTSLFKPYFILDLPRGLCSLTL